MAKSRSFSDKVNKKSQMHISTCPVCDSEFKRVQSIKSFQSESSGNWKFNKRMVNVCKCNEKEVYSI